MRAAWAAALLAATVAQLPAATPTRSAGLDSPRLAALERALARNEPHALPRFWEDVARAHTPLVERIAGAAGEVWMTFLWRDLSTGHSTGPSVLGQIGETAGAVEKRTPWPLARLGGSDVWYRTFRLPGRSRFSYHLAWPLDGARKGEPDEARFGSAAYDVFVDVLNPREYRVRWSDRGDSIRTSYAQGPEAPPERFIAARPRAPHGKIETLSLESPGSSGRSISVYMPPGMDHGCERCDLLVLFDAAVFLSAVSTPTILDNLQAEGVMGPVVAVFIGDSPTGDRISDLRPEPRLGRLLREDLLPRLRTKYRFTRDPRRAVIGGSSLGGLVAAYAALANADLFGNVISLSGSYWWWPGFNALSSDAALLNGESGWLIHEYASAPRCSARLYLDVGAWEGAVMLLPNRTLRDLLEAKGCSIGYREFVGGHDPVDWRSGLAEALGVLLGNSRPAQPAPAARERPRAKQ